MEQALAYVCCPADESRAKVQKYCRKIYELGYVPICPQYAFAPFLDDGAAEEQQDKTKMSHLILKRCGYGVGVCSWRECSYKEG